MLGQWNDFFVTEVTVAAGLTGLIFVGLSINLTEIIKKRSLVDRAAEALLLLVQPVAVGMTLLAPYSHTPIGLTLCAISLLFIFLLNLLLVRNGRSDGQSLRQFWARTVILEGSFAATLVGSALLVAVNQTGFGLIGFGTLVGVGIGILDAWVLLIEILR